MDGRDTHLMRLLTLAAAAKEESAIEAPFGFDTRIVALWREMKSNGNGDLTRFVRRIALVAIVITILGGLGTYSQVNQDDEAARALVQRLYPLVLRMVRSHRPARTAEEDLCQMIFIKLHSQIE